MTLLTLFTVLFATLIHIIPEHVHFPTPTSLLSSDIPSLAYAFFPSGQHGCSDYSSALVPSVLWRVLACIGTCPSF
jgi:hypothetical protein